MPEQVRKKKLFFNLLKKEKGQNLVGFALIVAFCAGIGLAAREAGLMEALNDTYSRQETAFAASDIKSGETKVSGDIGAVKIGGGGTNSSVGGSGSGSGGSAGGVTPQTDPPQTDPPAQDPPAQDPPAGPPTQNPPAGGGSNSTPGMPAGGQTGGGSGNSYSVVIGTVAATEHLKLQSEVIGTTQFNAINVSTWNQATGQEKLNTMKEGTLFYNNGEYYLMTTTSDQVQSTSVNNIINWNMAKKVTKRVVDETQLVDQWGSKYYPNLYSGDIVLYGGSAYLVKVEGNWHNFPLAINRTDLYTRIN